MFRKLKQKVKANPMVYYSLSIAASWAGAGSLMNSTTMAKTIGVLPALIWCIGNTLACIFFGAVIWKLPTVREVMRNKICRAILAVFSIFQIWLCMTAIQEAWASTVMGETAGTVFTYAVTVAFIVLLFRHGILTNVLTDDAGMYIIYGLVLVLAAVSIGLSGMSFNGLSLGTENVGEGIYKGLLLLPGPFTYPYFYKLLDYNEQNDDGVSKTDIIKCFCFGGLGFGLYLVFAFALIFTEISPVLNLCKAILLTVLAVSSLSSFIYSEFAVFGRKIGLGINVFATLFWSMVAPLGVMGVWTLLAESRVPLFFALIIISVILHVQKRYKAIRG